MKNYNDLTRPQQRAVDLWVLSMTLAQCEISHDPAIQAAQTAADTAAIRLAQEHDFSYDDVREIVHSA